MKMPSAKEAEGIFWVDKLGFVYYNKAILLRD